ncbi:MAG: 60S ribosomal export protein NMD3 [Thermoplasmata archaeon]|nr:60S ribosomal export protein NMD3 [Thermoplasmata archaeon]
MSPFCVECGTEGPVHDGLCANCLPTKRVLVELPPVLELERCVHCDRFHLPRGWEEVGLDEAVSATVEKYAAVARDAQDRRTLLHMDLRHPDEVGLRMAHRVTFPELVAEQLGEGRVRLRRTTCPDCAKQHGQYYEAILQVRAQERPVGEEEVKTVRHLIEERARGDPGLFVTKEERVHGGLDVYLSSNRAAKALAQRIKGQLGGKVTSSPKLHGRRGGRDVYRVTYAVRLPAEAA